MLQAPPDFEGIVQLEYQLAEAKRMYWHLTLFSFQWWFSFLVPFSFSMVWIKYVKRSQLAELVCYGLLWASAASYLDEIGTSLVLWEYPYTLAPFAAKNLSANFTSLPIIFMLLYQHYPTTKTFILATIATSLIFSFVFEPLLVWMGIYKLYHWKYYYSFPIYILLALIFRWITKKLFSIQVHRR